MADSEDLRLLLSGAIDLSRCDFREADLSGMDLRNRNFSHCHFEKSRCIGTLFDGSDLRNAKVSFMIARNAQFDGCQLESLHFGFTDLSGASLRNVKASRAVFQSAKLIGANLQGALLAGGSIDVDTVLEGVTADELTNFEGLKVLRPTSRNPLFSGYEFSDGLLRRKSVAGASVEVVEQVNGMTLRVPLPAASTRTQVTQAKLQFLLRNASVTRLTARQFAGQIEEALRDLPASNGNELAEPLQTALEFAEALRNLAPDSVQPNAPLNLAELTNRIAELETIVAKLTDQLADETKARRTAEELAASDGFSANYRRTAGKAAGYATVTLVAGIVSLGVPHAASYFLGSEHAFVQSLFNVLGRMPR
jgi:uncharacterized protein YjbI with pentapeptide repeats